MKKTLRQQPVSNSERSFIRIGPKPALSDGFKMFRFSQQLPRFTHVTGDKSLR